MTGLKLLLAVLLMLAVGLSGGLALLAALEPPRPTLVDPIEMREPRDTEAGTKDPSPRKKPKKPDIASSPQPPPPAAPAPSDQGDGGAAPAPPAAPVPAGDDDDDGDDGDDNGDETDD